MFMKIIIMRWNICITCAAIKTKLFSSASGFCDLFPTDWAALCARSFNVIKRHRFCQRLLQCELTLCVCKAFSLDAFWQNVWEVKTREVQVSPPSLLAPTDSVCLPELYTQAASADAFIITISSVFIHTVWEGDSKEVSQIHLILHLYMTNFLKLINWRFLLRFYKKSHIK